MEFRIIDCYVYHENDDDEGSDVDEDSDREMKQCSDRFTVQLFGVDEARQTYSVVVTDFKPCFYVKIPEDFNLEKRKQFTKHVKEKLGKYFESSLVECGLVNRAKLYGFDARAQHKFMGFKFSNMAAFHRAKNLWYKEVATLKDSAFSKKKGVKWAMNPKGYLFKGQWLELYEANIAPELRFFHIREISPTGWVRVQKSEVVKAKETTCHYEVRCSAADVVPLQKDTIVPLKICSFDLEASSSHGDFPLPIKDYKRLAQNMVDVVDAAAKPTVELAKNCVRTAFGLAQQANIDKVYPKHPLEHYVVDDLVEEWAESSIPTFVDLDSVMDEAVDDDDGDGEGADTEDEADEPEGRPKRQRVAPEELPKGKTIVTLLLDKTFDRLTKIAALTKSLDSFFPALEGDRVTFIGSSFVRYGETAPYLNHCINIGPTAALDNVAQVHCATERDLLLAWTRLVQEEDPDIVMGYNIFGFDENFLFKRSLETDCTAEFLQLGRKKSVLAGKRNDEGRWELEEKSLVVASGEYMMRYFNLVGRIHFDPYVMFRKEYNLDSYTLDNVAATFIRDKITSMESTDENTMRIFSSNLKGLERGNYVLLEEFTHSSTYLFNARKYRVLDVGATFFVVDKNIVYKKPSGATLSWCLVKDDVDHHQIFKMGEGSEAEKAQIAAYCVQDCRLVHHIVQKVDMITSCMEMANVCSVPFGYIVFRGQGAKLTSLIAKKCRENGILMPVLPSSEFDTGYEGALVLDPNCQIFEDPVAVNDFSSLYPSEMCASNLSSDSLVWFEVRDLEGNVVTARNPAQTKYDNLPGYKYLDRVYDDFKYVRKTPKAKAEKVKCGEVHCRWAQFPNGELGIMPAVLKGLLKARKDTRKKAETEPDPFMRGVLDKRQLAIKMTANSIYGQCGAKTSTFYNKHVAACTTAGGRAMIMYAKTIAEEVYRDRTFTTKALGDVYIEKTEAVYGDTDSVFFKFTIFKDGVQVKGRDSLEATIEIAQDVASVASFFLKSPHDWVYEKTFYPFILLKKKGYVGMLFETDVTKSKRKSMGIVLKRRDNAPIVKDVYGGVIDLFMNGKTAAEAVAFVQGELERMYRHDYPLDKFVVTKSLRSGYKNPKQIAHNVLALRIGQRDPGNRPTPGSRIRYAAVVTRKPAKGEKILQGDKIETPEFITANGLKLDYDYYVKNQIMKPVLQLLALSLEKLPGFNPAKFEQTLEAAHQKVSDPVKYAKKVETLRQAEVKALVFDRFLTAK
jgi:DNA polymerase elongation subunit (family B)